MDITTFNSLVKMESKMIININNYKKNNKKLKTRYSKWDPNELKEYRSSIGLTQKEMGFELGMSARMYRFYESGHTRVSLLIEYAMKHLFAVVISIKILCGGDKLLISNVGRLGTSLL